MAIWSDPLNPLHIGVLHRLLSYYADMSRRRRAADRQSKRRVDVVKRFAAPAPDAVSLSIVLLKLRNNCVCCKESIARSAVPNGNTTPRTKRRNGETAKRATIVCRCECGQVVRLIGLTRERFAKQAQAVLGLNPRPDAGGNND
jgi:hypothetical protein